MLSCFDSRCVGYEVGKRNKTFSFFTLFISEAIPVFYVHLCTKYKNSTVNYTPPTSKWWNTNVIV